jgi:hypothetical protein
MTSSAHLQREADARRVELADTLTQLRDGLAPAALSMGAMALAKGSGLSLVKMLANQTRANPVPALLIGAGLTMLLTRTSGADILGAAGSTLRSGAQAARSAASGVASAASAAATDAGQRVSETATDTAEHLRRQAGETYEAARQKVEERIESGRRTLHDGRDEATARAQELADKAREKAAALGEQTRQSAAHLIEEQPILVAALAAALGAAIGAALPLSRTEKDMIGAAGQRAVGAGRDAIATAADVVKEEVAKADIGGKVGDIADKVVQGVATDLERKGPGQTG